MWLRRCFEPALKLLAAALVLSVAGCASTGSHEEGPSVADGGAQPEIPPQAQTLFEQAVSVMAAGDYDEAELRLKEFLLQYPAYPGAYVDLAIIQARDGDDEAAQQSIDAALALDPEYPAALNQQGMLLRRKGKFLEAEAAYLKAVTAAPDYALAHYNLGVLNELYLQHLDAALQHFETYQELVGGDEEVEKWIVDLKRRVAANQRTANAAE
jgi:Tfp pilus assembly protein PilF